MRIVFLELLECFQISRKLALVTLVSNYHVTSDMFPYIKWSDGVCASSDMVLWLLMASTGGTSLVFGFHVKLGEAYSLGSARNFCDFSSSLSTLV